MQRWAQQRCIVSNCVVYAKNTDTHSGIRIFLFPDGLDPIYTQLSTGYYRVIQNLFRYLSPVGSYTVDS